MKPINLSILLISVFIISYASVGGYVQTPLDLNSYDWEREIDLRIYHKYHKLKMKAKHFLMRFNCPVKVKWEIMDRMYPPSMLVRYLGKIIGRHYARECSLLFELSRHGRQYRKQKPRLVYHRTRVKYLIKFDQWKYFVKHYYLHLAKVNLKFNFKQYSPVAISMLFIILGIMINPLFFMGIIGAIKYVDRTNGSDSATGDYGDDWQTISKVNSATINPADIVCFKRGETWSDGVALSLDRDGSAGNWVTYTAYGSGALPVFENDGAGEDYGAEGTGSYYTVSYIDFEYGDVHGVYISDSHIEIDNCEVHNADQVGIFYYNHSGSNLQTDIVVTNNVVEGGTAGGGIVLYGRGPYSEARGMEKSLTENNTIYDAKDNLQIHHSDANGDLYNDHIIRLNESYGSIDEEGIDLTAGRYKLIEYNYFHENNWGSMIHGNHSQYDIFRNNIGVDERTSTSESGRGGILLGATHMECYNNIMHMTARDTTRYSILYQPFNYQSPDDNNIIHNTFILHECVYGEYSTNFQSVFVADNYWQGSDLGGFTFYGNICVHSNNHDTVCLYGKDATDADIHIDYNLYYNTGGSCTFRDDSNSYVSLSTWKTNTSEDSHSGEGNPNFVDLDGDTYSGWAWDQNFDLTISSTLAINLGSDTYTTYVADWDDVDDSSPWDVSKAALDHDQDGDARSTPIDKGAKEYGVGGTPPSEITMEDVEINNITIITS